MDQDGVTTRSGARHRWADAEEVLTIRKRSSRGLRISFAGGKTKVTDGPFIETKEVLGGYWMIEVNSKQEAIEWASRCPGSDNEMIEIRQVQEMSDFPADVQEAAAKFPELQAQARK